jgi:hypothetical protein
MIARIFWHDYLFLVPPFLIMPGFIDIPYIALGVAVLGAVEVPPTLPLAILEADILVLAPVLTPLDPADLIAETLELEFTIPPVL